MRFKLLDIPVEVRPSFLLIAGFLGFSLNRVDLILAWVGVIFVSILVHELGHALTARHYGSEVAIELNAIGGLTSWTVPDEGVTPGRRARIAAAGSATGLLFGGLVWIVAAPFGPFTGIAGFTLSNLVRVNVFWGLLNWLPIRPLDGGHLFSSLLERIAPRRGDTIADVVFFVTAAAGVILAIYFQLIFVAILTGWLLWGELSRLIGPGGATTGVPVLDFDTPAENLAAEDETDATEPERPAGY
ncbi:MAG: site-2 protease family protein [Acidimicrobiia bacterium]